MGGAFTADLDYGDGVGGATTSVPTERPSRK